jgi:hypothetical protein
MKVYLMAEDGIELVGRTSLPEGWGGEYVVDIDIPGIGAALRLIYEVKPVPCLTPELKLVTECAVVLSLGQTPDFLPDWERVEQ